MGQTGDGVNSKADLMANSTQTNDGANSKTGPKANSTQIDDGADPKANSAKTDNSTKTASCPVTSTSSSGSSAALAFFGGILTIVILEALGFAWMRWYQRRKHSRYFDFSSNMGMETTSSLQD